MGAFRIITGLTLALLVATINGCSGIGYTIGGEFEISLQAAFDGGVDEDPRWQREETDDKTTLRPRDAAAQMPDARVRHPRVSGDLAMAT